MTSENDGATPTPSSEPAPVDWLEADTLGAPPVNPQPDNAVVEGGDDPPAPAKRDDPLADDDEIAAAGDDEDGPPEFWSAERKAEWEKLKEFPELRAAVKGHYEEATKGLNKKLEEAALARKAAEETAQKVLQNDAQHAAWWKANADTFAKTFVDRWQGVDWTKLASENPAEWARLNQMRADEHQLLAGAAKQAEEANSRLSEQRKGAEQQERARHHGELAARYPKAFGKPEVAQETYNKLSKFLVQKGIPAERVQQIYEAPIVEIVMEAYKYSQLRAKAKEVTTPKPGPQPASKTPTRIVPGAASKAASPADEATRQAEERLRSGERLSPQEAALAFR
jgi:hypothetical protein